ncbi:N-acetyltransferase [Marinomonas agarivorans]|nr:N-acetyltransferase [Marinomonas agarivorans]
MPLKLETDRLILRQWQDNDYEPFAHMTADSDVMRYFPNCLSVRESNQLADRLRAMIAQKGWGFWAVELKETQSFIGFVGLNEVTHSAIPVTPFIEVGWRLAKEHWRQGYATEAAQKALEFGFDTLASSSIYAFTPLSNTPSQKVMQKLGMSNTQQDFDHPEVPNTHSLARHCLYKIEAPKKAL